MTLWKTPGLTDLPGKKALLIQTIMVSSWASIVKSLLPQCCSQDNRYTHTQKKYNQDSLDEKRTTQWSWIFLTLYLRRKSRHQRAGFWLVKRIQQWWVIRGPWEMKWGKKGKTHNYLTLRSADQYNYYCHTHTWIFKRLAVTNVDEKSRSLQSQQGSNV